MPEVYFRVRWPDASTSVCYSPSSTISAALPPGSDYALADFVARSRAALEHASARVAAKYGYGCAHAQRQIEEIAERAAQFTDPTARVVVEDCGEDNS
jgi:uncharacterized repeat protein (TIGR04042 family)